MRSTEFIKEAGPGGPGRIPTDAEWAARNAQGEKNAQNLKNWWNDAPQTGGTAVPTAQDPAQQAGQGAATAAPAAPVAPASSFAGQTDEFGGMEQPAAQTSSPVQVGTGVAPSTQASTPVPKRAAPAISPAIVGYASSMGLYKNGKPDAAAIKAFQQKNGLTPDGIIGPDTSGAILSAAKPGAAGSGRGQQGVVAAPDAAGAGRGKQGGPAAPQPYEKTLPPMGKQQAVTPVPTAAPAAPAAAPPAKPVIGQPMASGQRASQSDVLNWESQYGPAAATRATSAANAAAAKQAYNPYQQPKAPRTFEESVDQMRRLSNMLKG